MEVENIEQIEQKLRIMNIQRIVSIDNEWNREIQLDLNKSIEDLIEEVHPKNREDLLRKVSNLGLLTIQDAYESKDRELIDIINAKKAQQEKLPPDLEKLNQILVELEKRKISIERIQKYKSDIFKKYNENCLFILDKEMDETANRDIVKESIPNILNEADDNGINHLIIVYSSNIGEEYKDNINKLDYVKNCIQSDRKSNMYIYKMFAIKKGENTELGRLLNQKMSECIYGDALYHYMLLEKKKKEYIYDKLCEIDNEEIARIAEDNIIEGSNIQDSIKIIEKAISKSNLENIISEELSILEKFNFYQKDRIKNFNSKNQKLETNNQYKKYRDGQDKEFIKNILESDLALWENIDYSINKFYKDISTGDIFKLKLVGEEKEQYALIVENACDCILRNQKNIKDIARKNKDSKIKVLIFNREDISNFEEKELIKLINSGEVIFPVKEDKVYCLKYTGKEITISSLLLDLCTINSNGEFSSDYDNDIIEKYKNYYFEAYMQTSQILDRTKILKQFSKITEEKWKEVMSLFQEDEHTISPVQIEHNSNGNLQIKRIGRLNYNITLRVCQKNYYRKEDDLLVDSQSAIELHKHRKNTSPSVDKMVGVRKQSKKE